MEDAGGACLAVPADVREPSEITTVVDGALERFGYVDVVVNNAGGQFQVPAEEITLNGWRAVHRLNVEAAWSLTREAATRSMIPRRRGVVVFVGFSPRRGVPEMVHALRPAPPWRTSPAGSLATGAGTASGPSASPPATSQPRDSTATRSIRSPPGNGAFRSAGLGRRRRWQTS